MRLFVADLSLGNISSSSVLSVMSKSSGHERLISAAFFKTLATVFLDTPHVETVILLSRKAPDAEIKVRLDMSELDITSAESKATYKEIQEYVKNKYDLHVTNSTFPADISK